jgi:hypothetical protein
VSVNAAPPAVALDGTSVVIVGTGLLTVKFAAVDVPPPGAAFVTVTGKMPAAAMSAAVIAAVTCVALTNVVVFAFPLNFTAELATNPDPFTVSVNAAPPTVALVGERVVIVGAGLLMVKVEPADVPPPGAGFVTVTEGVPAVAMSAAVIAAVTCVALTNVVVLAAPLKFTTDVATKFVPFTVSVNAAPPAVALDGASEVIVGTELLTVKFEGAEAPPPGPGLLTTTGKDPPVAMSAAVTAIVTCVAETNVTVLAAPLNVPVAPLTKLAPLMVSVNAAPPAEALAGARDVIEGTGLLMEKVCMPEVPPPGAGLVTLTFTTPAVAMSAAVIAAVNCVALANVAVGAATPNFTVDPETKPVPFSVSVKAAPPAVALVGEMEVRVGRTLFTVKSTAPVLPPPGAGLLTTTGKDPAVAMSGAVTAIVTCVELTKVTVLALPLNVPVAPLTKFVPLIVRVKAAPPAVALVGESEVIVAAGLLTVKVCALVGPPPGAGFVTVTLTEPPVVISEAGTVT